MRNKVILIGTNISLIFLLIVESMEKLYSFSHAPIILQYSACVPNCWATKVIINKFYFGKVGDQWYLYLFYKKSLSISKF